MSKMTDFVYQYLATALWASNDESDDQGGEPFDKNYDPSDFCLDAIKRANDDCDAFMQLVKDAGIDLDTVNSDWGQHGHDFWLTRNRHGVGFWDRGYGNVGDKLTDIAHTFGEVNLFITDFGQINFG